MNRTALRRLTLALLLVLQVCCSGCGRSKTAPPSMDDDPPEVTAVRATMPEGSWQRKLKAGTEPNPKGEGTIVWMGNAIYLVKGETVSAVNKEATGYSPSVPVTKELKPSDLKMMSE